MLNMATKRCVKVKTSKSPKKCPEGKTLNTKTNRCNKNKPVKRPNIKEATEYLTERINYYKNEIKDLRETIKNGNMQIKKHKKTLKQVKRDATKDCKAKHPGSKAKESRENCIKKSINDAKSLQTPEINVNIIKEDLNMLISEKEEVINELREAKKNLRQVASL
jgi:hypothetical protein